MSRSILTRSASEGMSCAPRLRFGLVSFPSAQSIVRVAQIPATEEAVAREQDSYRPRICSNQL